MTCVVGLITSNGDILFGADSQCTIGESKRVLLDKKIFKKGNMIFGFAGDVHLGQLVKHKFTPPAIGRNIDIDQFMHTKFLPEFQKFFTDNGYSPASPKNGKEKEEDDTDFVFLIGVEKNIYQIDNFFSIIPAALRLDAIGTGSDYAIGSLYASRSNPNDAQRLQMALDASATFSIHCSKPFHFESILAPKKTKVAKVKPKHIKNKSKKK